MIPTGLLHPTDHIPLGPDTVTTFLMTGGSSAQAQDWLSTGSTAMVNAAAAGVGIVRLTGMTTAGAAFFFSANLATTGAAVPTSGTSVSSAGPGGVSIPIAVGPFGQSMFQVNGGSTGFSFAALTSGLVIMEQWRK